MKDILDQFHRLNAQPLDESTVTDTAAKLGAALLRGNRYAGMVVACTDTSESNYGLYILNRNRSGWLKLALDSQKANIDHPHTIANVTDLQSALTGLQAALEGKAALSHPHTIANVTDLQPLLTEQTNNIDYLLWLVDKLKRWYGFTYPDPAEQPYFGAEMIMIFGDPAKQISINNLLDWHKMKLGIVTWGPTNFSPSMNMYGSYTGSMINNNFTVVITVIHNKPADPWKSTDEVNVYPFENMIGIAHCKSLECVVKVTSDAGASVGLVCYNIFGAGQNAYPTTMQQCNEVNESAMIVNPNDLYTSSYYSDAGKLPVASSIRLQFKSSPTLHATLAESRVRTFIIQGTMLNN